MSDEYDGQPDQCHECDQPAVGWDGNSGAMLCAEHYKRPAKKDPTIYAKKLVSRFNAVSDCDMSVADSAWLVNNVQDTIDFCTENLERRLRTAVEKNKHVVGVLEDLYAAIDTAHLEDDLRNDIREILKGDV